MTLWRPAPRAAFPHAARISRRDVHTPLNSPRMLRNRIAHHEPVFARHLKKDYGKILEITSWTAPRKRAWIEVHGRVAALRGRRGQACADGARETTNCDILTHFGTRLRPGTLSEPAQTRRAGHGHRNRDNCARGSVQLRPYQRVLACVRPLMCNFDVKMIGLDENARRKPPVAMDPLDRGERQRAFQVQDLGCPGLRP